MFLSFTHVLVVSLDEALGQRAPGLQPPARQAVQRPGVLRAGDQYPEHGPPRDPNHAVTTALSLMFAPSSTFWIHCTIWLDPLHDLGAVLETKRVR